MKNFKLGDKVRITDRIHGHEFKINEVVTITGINVCEKYHTEYILENDEDYWSLTSDEFESL